MQGSLEEYIEFPSFGTCFLLGKGSRKGGLYESHLVNTGGGMFFLNKDFFVALS